ncbi:MAG: hypothetical protein MZV63_05070 [Marinilabiliales bacterium]|nr:hypothetical protein [Marinilabiliales bacterium]
MLIRLSVIFTIMAIPGRWLFRCRVLITTAAGGCPGSSERVIAAPVKTAPDANIPSELRHWPVQMHLINPNAPFFPRCGPFTGSRLRGRLFTGSFHTASSGGKSSAIACPKLDHGSEIYIEKLVALIDVARVNTITVMMMEVLCCGDYAKWCAVPLKASRKVPVKAVQVRRWKILSDDWPELINIISVFMLKFWQPDFRLMLNTTN